MKLPFFPHHDGSSFYDFLQQVRPDIGPLSSAAAAAGSGRGVAALLDPHGVSGAGVTVPTGTTVLAVKYEGGVVMAGDRRATEGFQIADRRIQKVFAIDGYSAMAIAGAAGPCMEMAKLFQTELEHYEKIEGDPLSCEGKANKLSQMVKANLPMVFQGLVVMPIFAGYDPARQEGRIFKYDVTGGRYEESDYYAIGSGGKEARNTMREHYRPGMTEAAALQMALLALYNAAEDDVGTGGPDVIRGIYPTAKVMSRDGLADVDERRIRELFAELIASRTKRES